MLSRRNDFTRTRAATPCGVSLGTALAKTASGSSRASVWDDSCGSSLCARSRADSLKKTVLEPQAAADRLFHQVHAFDRNLALLVGAASAKARRSSFTRAFWRLSIAPQTSLESGEISHGGTGVYPTPPRHNFTAQRQLRRDNLLSCRSAGRCVRFRSANPRR